MTTRSPHGNPATLRLVEPERPAERKARGPCLDDSELLAAVRAGDPAVAGALYDRAHAQIERTVRRLLGSRDSDAEDVGQLAAIELTSSIDRYRGECSLDAWISTITARVVFKHIRRRRLERQLFVGRELDVDRGQAASVGQGAVAADLVNRVRRHLDVIDPNKAWTFLLHDVWGYDLDEVAQITNVSVAAAQSRLVRGRRELHERIATDPELADLLDDLEEGT
jgi:RNA polymerase sigma-70 factor (ECF subfamily)